ncbi:MAG TPA: hypothetical protein VK177_03565 [Flavobacteriales bacterium]|nr:hypothetical protein [Flavobacteriales bacterium]
MKTNQLLGVAGGLMLAIGTFLPMISFMGIGVSLWSIPGQAVVGGLFIALGLAGAFTAFKGGKTMSIVALVCGAAGFGLLMVKTQGAFGMFGIGAWLMLLGGVLLIAGGAMGMKGN